MIILYVFAKPKNKFTWYISVSFHFFPDILFLFVKKSCWNVNCDIWSPYAGERSDTITQVEHPNNTVTVFLSICRISRSLCRGDEISFQSDGLCGLKANSFHCLDLTFIQDTHFHYLDGPHSVVYIVYAICSIT
jgi:hypothetical protein